MFSAIFARFWRKIQQSLLLLVFATPLCAAQKFDFSVATQNIEPDIYYTKNYNPAAGGRGMMTWAQRQQNILNAMQALIGTNSIVAIQECDRNTAALLQGLVAPGSKATFFEPAGTNPIKLAFFVVGNWLHNTHNGQMYKFLNYYPFTTPGAQAQGTTHQGKGFYVLQIVPVDSAGTPHAQDSIFIVNVHLAGGPGGTLGYQGFRVAQMQEVANYIQANANRSQNWIVTGDFNTDCRTAQGQAIYNQILKILNATGVRFNDAFTTPLNQRASAYNQQLENLDYIFSSLQPVDTDIQPPVNQADQELLTRGYGSGNPATGSKLDTARNHFSDHATLSADFSLALTPISLPNRVLPVVPPIIPPVVPPVTIQPPVTPVTPPVTPVVVPPTPSAITTSTVQPTVAKKAVKAHKGRKKRTRSTARHAKTAKAKKTRAKTRRAKTRTVPKAKKKTTRHAQHKKARAAKRKTRKQPRQSGQ